MNTKTKVGLLGGTFNPPTLGHFLLAFECLNQQLVDEIWIIPAGKRTDKNIGVSPQIRLEMVKIYLNDLQRQIPNIKNKIKINDIEVQNGVTIKTYDLIEKLKNLHTNIQFKWIIGSDLLKGLKNWYQGEKLVKNVDFLIFNRPEYPINENPQSLPQKYQIIRGFESNISSTEVRQRFENQNSKQNNTVMGILPQSLIQYIQENSIYKIKPKL